MSTYSAQILATSGLVFYYRAAEASGTAMIDDSGVTGNAAYNASGVTLGQTSLLPADPATCVLFDGTNGRAAKVDSAPLDLTTQISFLAWVRPTVLGTHHIMYKFSSYGMSLRGSNFSWELTGAGNITSAASSVVANNTYMVAGTYNGTTQNLYINGVLAASAARSGQTISVNANNLEIGSVIGLEKWGGYLAHLSLFNVGLSAATIQDLYIKGVQVAPPVPGASASVYAFSNQAVAANAARKRITIYNDSDTTIWLGLGASAAVGSGPRLSAAGDRWTSTHYTGAISAIHNGYIGAKNLSIVEE